MTTRRELDCLRAVYEISSSGTAARLVDAATYLSVKPPTAFVMLDRLVRDGLLEKRGNDYVLTDEGKRQAEEVITAHRVVETLLYRAGFSPNEACVQARKFDTSVPSEVVRKLYDFLGKPSECPHGKRIACRGEFLV
ncbi:MAG: metal-dependent transcriptional regulator [Thermoprotei archaeon]